MDVDGIAAMTASDMATPELRRAARLTDARWLSLTEPWVGDRPDPAHWLTTMGLESARSELEAALRAGPDAIVVSGPTGHGKTLLLRSLWSRPPSGFAPLFVPFANVEPDELAGWILETAYRRWDRHPAAELARLLRANVRFGGRTLLLMDEVQATPRATLSKLFEIIAESGVAVSVVLAGLPGEALELSLTALPRSIRKVVISNPWRRADAELLLTQVARALEVDPTDLIAAVDVDAALRAGAGNPRLVRAALAARLRVVELPRARTPPVAVFAAPPPAAQLASAVRPEPSPGKATRVALPVTAGAVAARSRVARRDRNWDGIAAAWRRAVQALAIEITDLRRSIASRAVCAQAWLDRLAWDARVAAERAARSIRTRADRMASVLRDRASAVSARLESGSLDGSAAAWSRARGWARQVQATAANARLELVPRVHRGLTGAAQLLRRGTRPPLLPTCSVLAMAGFIAALAAIVADGRAPAPTITKPSGEGGKTIGEPILFRMNSHPWSTVEIDGVEAGTTPLTIPLAPGPHHFRVAMADGRILERMFVVSALEDRLAFR